jgi:prepilin-type N-terminal cleavage/methylation domain-containing protein/prepilin-type processing-associated H-X9-DG protein
MRRAARAFSLVELLVATAIIAVLLALLLPVLGRARASARSAACAASVRHWAEAHHMYRNANGGRAWVFAEPGIPAWPAAPVMWWEALGPYHAAVVEGLLCPEATEPGHSIGGAYAAWGPETLLDAAGRPRGTYAGSYGYNAWVSAPPAFAPPLAGPDAARAPLFFDCARLDAVPADADRAVRWRPGAGGNGAMQYVAMDRHLGGVNVAFPDAHVEHVRPAGLWGLKWSAAFAPRAVVVPD